MACSKGESKLIPSKFIPKDFAYTPSKKMYSEAHASTPRFCHWYVSVFLYCLSIPLSLLVNALQNLSIKMSLTIFC